ncbi:MAG: hypothetical protein ACO1OQ_07145, partial [Rufibacter sp.]
MVLKNILDFDTCMITLGLATLVIQWRWQGPEQLRSTPSPHSMQIAAASEPAYHKAYTPEWEITFPAGSNYQDLATPAGENSNPFTGVEQIASKYAGSQNWADKERALDAFLAAHQTKDFLFVLQQQVANEMLRRELFHHYYQDPTDPNMLASIAYYTDMLVAAKSEDSKLLYMCLRALKNHWPEKKRAQVAQRMANRIEERFAHSRPDTTNAHAYYQQVYARELKKMVAA